MTEAAIEFAPYRESIGTTLKRTLTIAVVLGAAMALASGGGLGRWPVGIVLALWPALGGHFVELWFLNWLRMRISRDRAVQIVARLLTWFVGGIILVMGIRATATVLGVSEQSIRPTWWMGGLGFIAIESVAHLIMHLRRIPNFYNGRG